jgi:5-methylcytosine-specific restriction protein A
MNWLISANSSLYDHASSFEHFGFIDWKQKSKYNIGDIVYIYCGKPIQKILYKCIVEEINLKVGEIRDDEEYWFDKDEYQKSLTGLFMHLKLTDQVSSEKLSLQQLLGNGLKAPPQGPKILSGELLQYIVNNFSDFDSNEFYPEVLNEDSVFYEGLRKQVLVNKYERSSIARDKCIEYHGDTCKVCETNFYQTYGELGQGFIHVHHLIPLHRVSKEYKIDYKEHLVPVCPNCHAMLHRKLDGEEIDVERLKEIVRLNKG